MTTPNNETEESYRREGVESSATIMRWALAILFVTIFAILIFIPVQRTMIRPKIHEPFTVSNVSNLPVIGGAIINSDLLDWWENAPTQEYNFEREWEIEEQWFTHGESERSWIVDGRPVLRMVIHSNSIESITLYMANLSTFSNRLTIY